MIKLIIMLFLLSSCSSFSFYSEVLDSIKTVTFPKNQKISQEFYKNFEYSFLKAKFGRSNSVIMVLEKFKDSKYYWISSDGIRLVTNSFGKVIDSQGLPNDIFIPDLKVRGFPKAIPSYRVNFYTPRLNDSFVETISINEFNDSITYLGTDKEVKRYEVLFNVPEIYWRNKNLYWLDGDKPLKTIQKISPNQSLLELTFFIK